ncbi:DUF6759 domain-containing protein [Frigoriflavimonas asaccharolytica]|uniref:DUF6759 domain-containing protein n=1 Tax=Frigoriflavimonas asaccharolytica TaxID=2735899 RepID=A0A8J8K999_9FLAO|nr:DUF6759 domain-containing protein [Frigoriflavimonas asaccharolytica]NRS93633.1 hypothetical protein [Frigoriflavimonas asaccharolytica]
MRKLLLSFFLFSFLFSFSQIYTIEQVENTTDPKVIASWLKANPDNARNNEFKIKLVKLITKDNDPFAKPTVKPLKKGKLVRDLSRGKTPENSNSKQTANVLNELFNNDPNKKTVVVQIKNNSDCSLIVKFTGKDFYNLSVPAKNHNFVVVNKGKYILTTMVCDAKYSSTKNLTQDIAISLNSK